MEPGIIVKQEGASSDSGTSPVMLAPQQIILPASSSTQTSSGAMFIPRITSPRQSLLGATTATRFVLTSTPNVGLAGHQQTVFIAPGPAGTQSPFLTAAAANSPRKLIPVLPAGAAQAVRLSQGRQTIAVVSGGATVNRSFASPIIQPAGTIIRSPAKIAVVKSQVVTPVAGQTVTIVANNIVGNTAIRSATLSPYKVVIRPPPNAVC